MQVNEMLKKTLKGVLAGVILACAFLGVKNAIAYQFPSKSCGMQAAIKEETIENLFLGSSLFRQGIDITALEEGLEGNSFVMSYNGNQPVQMLEELKMLLRNDVEISNVYMDLYVYSCALRPAISDTRLIWDMDMTGKNALFSDMVTYSQAGFQEFFDFYVSSNNEYMIFYPVFQMVMKGEFYKGGNIRNTAGSSKEVLDALNTPGDREGIHPVQRQAIEQIMELCKEKEIQLSFIEIPKYQTLEQAEYYVRLKEELEECIGQATYYKAEDVEFDNENPEYYQDLFHLSGEGRRTYTAKLIEKVKQEETGNE